MDTTCSPRRRKHCVGTAKKQGVRLVRLTENGTFARAFRLPFVSLRYEKERAKAKEIGRLRSDACSCGQKKKRTQQKEQHRRPAGGRKIENNQWLLRRPRPQTKTKHEECDSIDLSRAILAFVRVPGQERSRSGAGLYSNDPAGAGHCAAALVRGEHRLAAKCGNSLSTSGRATAGVCQRGAVCESRPAPLPYCDFRCK